MKTAVVFQGGGALGAFGAGAWSRLRPWLDEGRHELVALAGASIGALNAALAAAEPEDPDRLAAIWRTEIATPSAPLLGWAWGPSEPARRLRSWNGFLTGLLFGTRGLFNPQLPNWAPWPGVSRLHLPLYGRSGLHGLLQRHGLPLASAPGRPLLAMSATALASGRLTLLHSDEREILSHHVAASMAIPGMFAPVDIDGEPHSDGDLVRDSLVPPLLRLLQDSGRVAAGEPLQLVTIEQYPREAARLPADVREIAYRVLNLLQQGKLVEGLALPGNVRRLRIVRPPLPNDAVSGEFDFSIERIEELVAQGAEAAASALAPAPVVARAVTHERQPA